MNRFLLSKSAPLARSSNFELLRIVSMAFIVIFHCVYKSGFAENSWGGRMNSVFLAIFWHLGEIGVNIFVLISGYFCTETKFKWSKLILLALQTEFYILLGKCVLSFLGSRPVSSWRAGDFLFPLLRPKYWFVSVYALLYVASPYLKRLCENLTRTEFSRLLLIQLFVWSVFPTALNFLTKAQLPEDMAYYNRYVWLFVVYLTGAYMRRFGFALAPTAKKAGIFLLLSSILLILFIVLSLQGVFFWRTDCAAVYFWQPNSLFVFVLSVLIFQICVLSKPFSSRIVNYVASCTLGVYMLHDGVLAQGIWHFFDATRFSASALLVPYILLCSLCIFAAGIAADSFRKILEKPLISLGVSR